MSLCLMQEEKQTQISKANKKPVTPYSPSTSSLPPSLKLSFGFEFGLGWVGFWLPRDECHVVKFVQWQKAATEWGRA